MKNYFLNLIFIFLSVTSILSAQKKFVLEAEISGLDENTWLIINPFLPNMNINIEDENGIYIIVQQKKL